jgi:hypothetical protein
MKYTSTILAAASGSLAGATFSRNKGGPYIRARAIPVNPNTPLQQFVRSLMAQHSAIWSGVLDDDDRSSWDTYAANVPLPDSLGNPRDVGGIGMYQRCNIARLNPNEATILRIDKAPTLYNLGEYTAPIVDSASASADTVDMSYDNTDEWANEDLALMIFSLGRPQNPGVNYFKGPYQFAGVVLGDSVTPPTSPVVLNSPFPFEAGQRMFVKVNVSRADGRLSASFRGDVLAT